MKEEICFLQFDRCERGAVVSGLEDLKIKRAEQGKTNEFIDALLKKIRNAPTKSTRIRLEQR